MLRSGCDYLNIYIISYFVCFMGNLLTLTLYMDDIHKLKDDPEGTCDRIYQAAIRGKAGHIGNLVVVQRVRHADEHTSYVHMGNTVSEMNPYSRETQKLMRECPDYFENMLKFMERETKELRAMHKEYKAEKKNE